MKLQVLHKLAVVAFCSSMAAMPLKAENVTLGETWRLDPQASELRFQSIKNETKVESSTFEHVQGVIEKDGEIEIAVALDSINTTIDLRNVRMRFLFFETFKFPEALITAQLTSEIVSQVLSSERAQLMIPVELELYGVRNRIEGEVVVSRLPNGSVSVASQRPISIAVADFGMMEGLEKLQRVAGVKIVPSATVTFDFVFKASEEDLPLLSGFQPLNITDAQKAEFTRAALQGNQAQPTASRALETTGNFSEEACVGRFEILSQTGNIFFAPGSADLTEESIPLLREVVDIVSRCPGQTLQIAGHTDNNGSYNYNLALSRQRAASVLNYLVSNGIEPARLSSVGFGETSPVATNATAQGRSLNRRIEFVPG